MTILFHGLKSTPGALKPTYLRTNGPRRFPAALNYDLVQPNLFV